MSPKLITSYNYLRRTTLCYEHVQESTYVRLLFCTFLTVTRSRANTMCNFEGAEPPCCRHNVMATSLLRCVVEPGVH